MRLPFDEREEALLPCDVCGMEQGRAHLHNADGPPLSVGLVICHDCFQEESTMNSHRTPDIPTHADIPANTDVILTDDQGKRWRTRTRSTAWALGDGTRVQLVEGIAGGYLASRLMRGTDPELPHFSERLTQSRPRGVAW